MAQTRIDVRVRDFINPKLGNLVPLPVVNGTLSGNFAASMWDGSQWVNVGSPNATTVPLQVISARIDAAPTTIQGQQRAPHGSYSRVRLILQGVTANIAAGSGFGGITLSSDTTIRLGGNDHYVELPVAVVPFSLEDHSSVTRVILFDLGSQKWLTRTAAESGQVEDEALQALIGASTSLEPR